MKFVYDPVKEKDIFERMAKDGVFSAENADYWRRELENTIETGCEYLKRTVDLIEKNWLEVEENFTENMSRFFEKEISIDPEIICYLMRFSTFPYSKEYKWFCTPLFGSPTDRNRVIMHELTHFFTPDGLPRSLKEALPVIINDRESFKMYSMDRGNAKDTEEMRLRPIILEAFKNGETFSQIVKKLDVQV